jgi:hypothetical protein
MERSEEEESALGYAPRNDNFIGTELWIHFYCTGAVLIEQALQLRGNIR